MTVINHIHSSGRYNRSVESLKRAVNRYTKDADLITLTETEYASKEAMLRKVQGYGSVIGTVNNRNDCTILFKKSKYRLIHHENFKLSNLSFELGGHRTPPSYATFAVLEVLKTKKRIVVGVIHAPSDVETSVRTKRRTQRVRAWAVNTRAFRTRTNKLRKQFHADAAMMCADWNVNFKLAWVRTMFRVMYPRWKATWVGHLPKGRWGTLGVRIIDATFIRGAIHLINIRLYDDDPSSDHRPFFERLSLKG